MPANVPIVLLLGQSNMKNPDLPIAAAENIASKGGVVVFHAISGSPLSMDLDTGNGDWSAADDPEAGEHLDDALGKLDALTVRGSSAFIPGSYLAGVIWVQGEADAATDAASAAYHDNLLEMHELLVDEYGAHQWALASLSGNIWEFREIGLNREPFWHTVRDGQLALDGQDGITTVDPDVLAGENAYSTEDQFQDDFIHYEPDFAGLLGGHLAAGLDIDGDANLQVGSKGNDLISVDEGGVQQVYGSTGNDTADFSGQDHGIRVDVYERDVASVRGIGHGATLKGNLVEVERIIGTDYRDVFDLGTITRDVRSGGGNDTVRGGDHADVARLGDGDDSAAGRLGNDVLLGQRGNDRLSGHAGNDRLYGGHDDDLLRGGAGDDLLWGGRGDDDLRGNKGHDTLQYQMGDNGSDRVYGFSKNQDVISFENTDVTIGDLFLSVDENDLLIHVDSDRVDADIRLVNKAHLLPDEDEDGAPDWLFF